MQKSENRPERLNANNLFETLALDQNSMFASALRFNEPSSINSLGRDFGSKDRITTPIDRFVKTSSNIASKREINILISEHKNIVNSKGNRINSSESQRSVSTSEQMLFDSSKSSSSDNVPGNRPEKQAFTQEINNNDSELELLKKTVNLLSKNRLPERTTTDSDFTKLKEIYELLPISFYDDVLVKLEEIRHVYLNKKKLDKQFPGGGSNDIARHNAGSKYAADKLGVNFARQLGIAYEIKGSFEITDILKNELGFRRAGFGSFYIELSEYVYSKPDLFARYFEEQIRYKPFSAQSKQFSLLGRQPNKSESFNLGLSGLNVSSRLNKDIFDNSDTISDFDSNNSNSSIFDLDLADDIPGIAPSDYDPELFEGIEFTSYDQHSSPTTQVNIAEPVSDKNSDINNQKPNSNNTNYQENTISTNSNESNKQSSENNKKSSGSSKKHGERNREPNRGGTVEPEPVTGKYPGPI